LFIIPLFKNKGDVEDPNGYRGIFLMSACLKLLHRIMMTRLRVAMDEHLEYTQNAYREGRSCAQHFIAALQMKHIAEAKGSPLVLLFVDFVKAFDSVSRAALRRVLEWWRVPENLITLMFDAMSRISARVRLGRRCEPGDPMCLEEGVLQGDTLAPLLFILCIDIVLRCLGKEAQHGAVISARVLPKVSSTRGVLREGSVSVLTDTTYADDILLFSNTRAGAERLLHTVERIGALFNLHINVSPKGDKTALIAVNARGAAVCSLDGKPVPVVKQYKYLGFVVGASWKEDWRRRKVLANGLMHQYRSVWQSGTTRAKEHMFYSLIVPTLTYGLSCYPWTTTVLREVNAFHRKLLRRVFDIRVDSINFTHQLIERFMPRHPTITTMFTFTRLREVGQWVRNHESSKCEIPLIDVFDWEVTTRGTGPRKSMLAMARCHTWEELKQVAMSPTRWLQLCCTSAVAEERSVALETGRRREREPRGWSAADTAKLVKDRTEVAERYTGLGTGPPHANARRK
jgi:hypothetical protein